MEIRFPVASSGSEITTELACCHLHTVVTESTLKGECRSSVSNYDTRVHKSESASSMAIDRLINQLDTISFIDRIKTGSNVIVASGLSKPSRYRPIHTLLQGQGQGQVIEELVGHGRDVIGALLIRIVLLDKSDNDVPGVFAPLLRVESHKLNEPLFFARFRNPVLSGTIGRFSANTNTTRNVLSRKNKPHHQN